MRNAIQNPATEAPSDAAGASPAVAGGGLHLAYTMSRFPKLTETFVLYEIVALDEARVPVDIWPLLRERQKVVHAEAAAWVERAHFHPFLSWKILAAQLHFLLHRPLAYLKVLAEVLAGTAGSLNFFVGALGIFPKSVRFAYEMRERGVTHLHAHFATHPAVAALIVHRLTGIPFSFTAHGSDLHVDRRMLDRKLEAAAFAVTVSHYNKELMVRECGEAVRSKIHVVRCGVDPRQFPGRAAAAPGGPLRILCVASFEEVKGHPYLIEACRMLESRGIDFVCHLVGDGPRRSEVEARIDGSGLQDRLVLHGLQPRDAVLRQLGAADVLVLASVPTRQGKREGIPVVLMEGMASGLAVVASDLSGIPELVEHEVSGLLVPPRDAQALAAAFERLAGDPELRARLGRGGREKVEREFDLRRNVASLIALFRSHAVHAESEAPRGAAPGGNRRPS